MVDVVVFAALGWEARAVLDALQGVEADGLRSWRGYLGDGGAVRVLQIGVGPERARRAAEAATAAPLFLSVGCAGGLAAGLRAGEVLVADRLLVVDAAGDVSDDVVLGTPALAAWARARGMPIRLGAVASSPVVLEGRDVKARVGGTGSLVVEMEGAGVAAAARARGVDCALVKVVLDEAGDAVALPGGPLVDVATGELSVPRALRTLAPRPDYWPTAMRLARQQRAAERGLRGFLGRLFSAGLDALGLGPGARASAPAARAG